MRLKSLEIKGFKSFADKTFIQLDHPITGIVGPNGCGKSNIVDAIRWVIGEHKIKSLRSDNLDDLVFNGSKTRSAAGMAEVSLTFENTRNLLPTEFSTVTITRKFYKSGESEYRLNDVACRLKDIHNLFMDTGVSSDSYAIIELGMVDDIIKDKEGSRRRMLEQAAGISIYKTRKKEALQKLEGTQSDISRIDDLLFEIENNLKTLEGQAKKAEKFLQIREDYRAISIELAKTSLQDFNDKYQSLNDQLNHEQDKKIKIEAEIAGDEAEIESNKLTLIQREQELARAQKAFNDLVNRIRALESEKKLAAQHLTHLQEREYSLKKSLESSRTQLELLENAVEDTKEKQEKGQETLEDLKDRMEDLRDELDNKRELFDVEKQKLEAQRKAIQEKQMKQFEFEKQTAVADTTMAGLKRSALQLENEWKQRQNQIVQLKDEYQQAKVQFENLNVELNEMLQEQERLQKSIIEEEQKLDNLKDEANQQNRKLDATRNEHDLLKSLMDSLEGYPDSIKFLKKNPEWNSKAPLLSDIFTVQDGYRVALEAVLDNYLNYYVVADIHEAAQAIELLEKHKKGKANFFLLNSFETLKVETNSSQKGLKSALEVVDVEEKYRNLLIYLLNDVFITEEETVAGAELVGNEQQIFIAKSGKFLQGKYSLSGGSTGLFSGNKIGRAKNLERLAKEMSSLQQNLLAKQEEMKKSQSQLQNFKSSLQQLRINQVQNSVHQANNKMVQLQNKTETLEQLNERENDKLKSLQEQIEDSHDSIGDVKEALSVIYEEVNQLKEQLQLSTVAFEKVEQEYNVTQQQYNNQNLLITKQQSQLETFKQELTFRKTQIEEVVTQQKINASQLEETAQKISEATGKLNFGDNELFELLDKKELDEKSLNEQDQAYYAFRNQIAEHEQKISRQRREKENAETLVNATREKINEMKLTVAGMKERLQVEFRVQLETILEEARTTTLSLEELNQEAEKLKRRMDNLGEINPTAIEAYQEIKIRYDFIIEQKNDLESAKQILMETIEEVERTANEKFKETFEQVRLNFQTVFKALFSEEDKADLRLTDENNMADTNIEIYAQPKGKRPSTLTQLSGGEKTLTSTAFLFAIYLIKPAPFCILDEVDAPLDDANVMKFSQMIRKFSDNSQFIIVTHNKQTMASVDVIYGVTMQEMGVSKLVPVDFRSLN